MTEALVIWPTTTAAEPSDGAAEFEAIERNYDRLVPLVRLFKTL